MAKCEPTVLQMLENNLLRPERVWSRQEVLTSPVPTQPGIYAWFFQEIPRQIPTTGCTTAGELTLLYIGLSPKSAMSSNNLRNRIRSHYRGNASGSTLRYSLGVLLAEKLELEMRRVGRTKRFQFADGEERLNEWMETNAFVVWHVISEPWFCEHELIKLASPPLNVDGPHPFSTTLHELRTEAKTRAKQLPPLP